MARTLAQAGLVAADADDLAEPTDDREPWYLWTEHEQALGLWTAVQTQWRHAGMDGTRTGLCYAGVQVVLAHRVRPALRKRRFADIQIMERAALDAWAEQRAAAA